MGRLNDINSLHEPSFKHLFGFLAAINLSSCLHRITRMLEMVTEIAFNQNKPQQCVLRSSMLSNQANVLKDVFDQTRGGGKLLPIHSLK